MKRVIVLAALLGALSFNLYKNFNFLWADLSIIKNFPTMTYDRKMHEKYGYYYDFMMFIKNNTPENAIILIPPSRPPWAGSGNGYLSNYFLYPRRLINEEIDKPPADFKLFTHVLVVWKDFEAKGLEKLYGWPKFEVPAKEIFYMATDSAKVDKIKFGDYQPQDPLNIGRYGLIKL